MLREVRLYGKLGAEFGRVHHFDVATPAEAVKALMANFPRLEKWLYDMDKKGYRYAFFNDRDNVPEKELDYPAGRATIRIAPVLAGSKNAGLWETILGAVLIVVGVYTNQYWLAGMGLSMMLGGIARMLAPIQQLPGYAFSGPVNTTEVGVAIPVGYGRLRVGSVVISAGLYTNDIPLDYRPNVIPAQPQIGT